MSIACQAVIAGMPRQAPASKLIGVRQLHRLRGGQHDVFGRGAERALPLPVPDPHPLADTRVGDALAHRVDLARAVAVRDDARKRDLARRAGAVLHVRTD